MDKRSNGHEVVNQRVVFQLTFFIETQTVFVIVIKNSTLVCGYGCHCTIENCRQVLKFGTCGDGRNVFQPTVLLVTKVVKHHHYIELVSFAVVRTPESAIEGSRYLILVSATPENEVEKSSEIQIPVEIHRIQCSEIVLFAISWQRRTVCKIGVWRFGIEKPYIFDIDCVYIVWVREQEAGLLCAVEKQFRLYGRAEIACPRVGYGVVVYRRIVLKACNERIHSTAIASTQMFVDTPIAYTYRQLFGNGRLETVLVTFRVVAVAYIRRYRAVEADGFFRLLPQTCQRHRQQCQ